MNKTSDLIQEVSVEQIETHIRRLEGIRHPVFAPEALEHAADYIRDTLQSYGLELIPHQFTEDGKPYRNIIGLHRGTAHPEKQIIVIAHFDTVAISPGADDNASGVAAMLELARVFQRRRFEKSLLFVGVNLEEQKVDGEQGSPVVRGSRALAKTAQEEGWEIEGVINFETIAYAGDDILQHTPANFPLKIPEVGNFIAVIGNEHSVGMVQGYARAIEAHQIHLPCLPIVVPGNGEILPDTRRSDHAPFWDIGAPAIMLTNTANFRTPHYHQPSDTLETLNLPFAAAVCRAGAALLCEMARIEGS